MIEIFAVLLIILWLLGMLTTCTFGGLIHVLLVVAILAMLLRLTQSRSAW